MTVLRTIRRFHAALLALFVVAQVAGVVPLIYDHTLNVYEGAPVAAHGHPHVTPTAAVPDADHHHGLLDLHDQCCVLQILAGPLPAVIAIVPVGSATHRIAARKLASLVGGDPPLLDRPPRPQPLI